MSPSQVIVLATPVFLGLIAIEFAWGRARKRNTYRLNDAINSISLGMLSQISAVLTRLFRVGIYTAIYGAVAMWHSEAFWTSGFGWLLALVFYDLCYYWFHRISHQSAIFWASHVVHHQSQEYNLSTALRQTSSGALLGWIFYVPMALAGVPPLVFGVVALVDLLYQFWVHTEHVPKLGWFDRWFCSPSNHRVHHAVNDRYIDRNHGGILIVWDRIFGTFVEEDEKCVYGTRAPLNSWDPLWSNAEVYWALAKDCWHARNWADKVRVWFKAPGWRPADVAARFPRQAFDIAKVECFHPPMATGLAGFACVQFLLLLAGAVVFLWNADAMPLSRSVVWLAALGAGLWSLGAAMQGRISMLEAVLIEAAALSVAGAAIGLGNVYSVFKPLAMVLAIAFAIQRGRPQWTLIAALAFSLAGDVLLLLPGRFIPGLVAFLAAHLCYITLFRRDAPWFASRKALITTLGAAAVMYAVLFAHLGPVLKVAVAAYAVVIALMAAQAIGRATVIRDRASIGVAVGSVFFMLSDSVLAINKFAVPLPMAEFAILSTYYVAQILIVHHVAPAAAAFNATSSPTLDAPAAAAQ
jgi:alkylglycerol monooxygenase